MLDLELLEEIARDLPHLELAVSAVVDNKLLDLIVQAGLLPSKSEAQRMVQSGGIYLNNQKIEDIHRRLSTTDLIGGKYKAARSRKKEKSIYSYSFLLKKNTSFRATEKQHSGLS